jgi:hypothetical protein
MRTVARRIAKLEDRFLPGNGKPQLLLVVTAAGKALALDQDRCIQILRECGFLPTGPVGLVNLGEIPNGLNAEELERFLRKDGEEICGLRSVQNHGGDHGGERIGEGRSETVDAKDD